MKHLSLIAILAVTITLVGCTGCTTTTITPKDAGIAAGTAAYLGYERVAAKKDEEFQKKVANIWAQVNEIETVDDLVSKTDLLTVAFNEILEEKELSDADKALLIALEQLVLNKVKIIAAEKIGEKEEAIQFLLGVREGVNNMIDCTVVIEKK